MEQAYFSAGCFWHVQKEFEKLDGVLRTEVGYIGTKKLAKKYRSINYKLVCSGVGFIESIKIDYDETKIDYDRLLDLFWKVHDPTSRDKQGADIGVQYRSAIFYTSPAQLDKIHASKIKARLNLEKPIVTKIHDFTDYEFFRAEDYHQHYLDH